MKVRNSLKSLRSRHRANQIVRRKGRVYIINNGHIAHEGPADEIKAQPEVLQRYLGV